MRDALAVAECRPNCGIPELNRAIILEFIVILKNASAQFKHLYWNAYEKYLLMVVVNV